MTDNAYRARCFLREIITLDTKLKINLLEQEALFNKAQGCGSITIGERIQSTPLSDAMELAIIEMDELQDEYNRMMSEYLCRRKEAWRIIAELPEQKHQNILRMKYCGGYKLEDIAEKLNYSIDHIKRLHREALEEFGKKMP